MVGVVFGVGKCFVGCFFWQFYVFWQCDLVVFLVQVVDVQVVGDVEQLGGQVVVVGFEYGGVLLQLQQYFLGQFFGNCFGGIQIVQVEMYVGKEMVVDVYEIFMVGMSCYCCYFGSLVFGSFWLWVVG